MAVFYSHGLGVWLISNSLACNIDLFREIDNNFPLSISVQRSLGSSIENIRWTNISTKIIMVTVIMLFLFL